MEFLNETTYVDQAERIIDSMTEKRTGRDGKEYESQIITTSKIRNILAMAADIYNNVLQNSSNELNEEIASRITYLKVRMIYECGRDQKVKVFIDKTHLIDYAGMVGKEKRRFILLYQYLEALVAFHRYHGGND